jgi:hypothetical protein
VSTADYAAIDQGYATTIHKSQGATVDRAYVLSSGSMDRHLTYVAMTRHREEATLYAGRDEFGNLQGLSARLGRPGLKETTLDYARDFAEQRGMADRLGVSSEIVVPGRAESDAQRMRAFDREGAARPSEFSPEGAAKETQPRAAPDREKLRAYGEGAGERQEERAQTSTPREAQETERQHASPSLDAERMQAIAQEAKLPFYKAEGAAKAREAFTQAEARRAMEAERVRAEAERQRLAEEQLLKEQNREREVMRQRSQSHGHER